MKYTIIIIFLSSPLFGQDLSLDIPVIDQIELDVANFNTMKTYGVETFDNRMKGVEGSVFIQDDWNTGEIKVVSAKAYSQYKFKYNVLDQNLILNIEGRFFALPGMFVESFVVESNNETTESSRTFIRKFNEDQEVYFLEVLVNGRYTLYKKHEIHVRKANYNAALDTGDANDKLELNKTYFLSVNDSMVEIPRKTKKFKKLVVDHNEIINLIDDNNFDLTDEPSLLEFANKLNATIIN